MVLRNLLSNAVKFSPPGGVLSIEGAGVEGAYELRITDQGKGFGAAGAHEIVLGEGAGGDFARKEGTTVGESGLGVGLSLCARICAREGHRVVLQNHPRGGATSRFAIKDRPTEADTA
jgi:signal transduction histidine kinase